MKRRPTSSRKRVEGVLGGAIMRRADWKTHYNWTHAIRENGKHYVNTLSDMRLTGIERSLWRAKIKPSVKRQNRYERQLAMVDERRQWKKGR